MEKKIRVLHYGLSSKLGGIETYLYKIASNIDLKRFEFNFLIHEGEEPCYYGELEKLNCKFFRMPSRRNNPIKNRKILHKIMENEKFDIVHCHQNSLSYIFPCIEGIKSRANVIVHSHNADINKRNISYYLHKMNYKRMQRLDVTRVAVSDLAGKWMFGTKLPFIVLNNGLDVNKYAYSENVRERIREEYKLTNRDVIINVGAFRVQKNHELIIRIFTEYLKKHQNAILMLVGDGELKEEIIKMTNLLNITDKVLFMGKRNDISSLLSASDKFLFPSFYEGFPNALIEAECSGLPCIVSETITEQSCIGKFCTRISLEAPLEEWVDALENVTYCQRATAPDLIMQSGLDIDSEINKLSELYDSLVKNKRG